MSSMLPNNENERIKLLDEFYSKLELSKTNGTYYQDFHTNSNLLNNYFDFYYSIPMNDLLKIVRIYYSELSVNPLNPNVVKVSCHMLCYLLKYKDDVPISELSLDYSPFYKLIQLYFSPKSSDKTILLSQAHKSDLLKALIVCNPYFINIKQSLFLTPAIKSPVKYLTSFVHYLLFLPPRKDMSFISQIFNFISSSFSQSHTVFHLFLYFLKNSCDRYILTLPIDILNYCNSKLLVLFKFKYKTSYLCSFTKSHPSIYNLIAFIFVNQSFIPNQLIRALHFNLAHNEPWTVKYSTFLLELCSYISESTSSCANDISSLLIDTLLVLIHSKSNSTSLNSIKSIEYLCTYATVPLFDTLYDAILASISSSMYPNRILAGVNLSHCLVPLFDSKLGSDSPIVASLSKLLYILIDLIDPNNFRISFSIFVFIHHVSSLQLPCLYPLFTDLSVFLYSAMESCLTCNHSYSKIVHPINSLLIPVLSNSSFIHNKCILFIQSIDLHLLNNVVTMLLAPFKSFNNTSFINHCISNISDHFNATDHCVLSSEYKSCWYIHCLMYICDYHDISTTKALIGRTKDTECIPIYSSLIRLLSHHLQECIKDIMTGNSTDSSSSNMHELFSCIQVLTASNSTNTSIASKKKALLFKLFMPLHIIYKAPSTPDDSTLVIGQLLSVMTENILSIPMNKHLSAIINNVCSYKPYSFTMHNSHLFVKSVPIKSHSSACDYVYKQSEYIRLYLINLNYYNRCLILLNKQVTTRYIDDLVLIILYYAINSQTKQTRCSLQDGLVHLNISFNFKTALICKFRELLNSITTDANASTAVGPSTATSIARIKGTVGIDREALPYLLHTVNKESFLKHTDADFDFKLFELIVGLDTRQDELISSLINTMTSALAIKKVVYSVDIARLAEFIIKEEKTFIKQLMIKWLNMYINTSIESTVITSDRTLTTINTLCSDLTIISLPTVLDILNDLLRASPVAISNDIVGCIIKLCMQSSNRLNRQDMVIECIQHRFIYFIQLINNDIDLEVFDGSGEMMDRLNTEVMTGLVLRNAGISREVVNRVCKYIINSTDAGWSNWIKCMYTVARNAMADTLETLLKYIIEEFNKYSCYTHFRLAKVILLIMEYSSARIDVDMDQYEFSDYMEYRKVWVRYRVIRHKQWIIDNMNGSTYPVNRMSLNLDTKVVSPCNPHSLNKDNHRIRSNWYLIVNSVHDDYDIFIEGLTEYVLYILKYKDMELINSVRECIKEESFSRLLLNVATYRSQYAEHKHDYYIMMQYNLYYRQFDMELELLKDIHGDIVNNMELNDKVGIEMIKCASIIYQIYYTRGIEWQGKGTIECLAGLLAYKLYPEWVKKGVYEIMGNSKYKNLIAKVMVQFRRKEMENKKIGNLDYEIEELYLYFQGDSYFA